MAMMPSPDPDFHDLNWCTSSSSLAAHEWINQSLVNYHDETSNGNEHLRGGFFNQKEIRPSSIPVVEAPNENSCLSQVIAQELVFPGSIQDYNNQPVHPEAVNVSTARLQYTCMPNMKIKEEMVPVPRLWGAIDEKLLARALQNSSHDPQLLPSTEDFMHGASINACANLNFPSAGDNNYNMAIPSANMYLHTVPLPGTLDVDLHAFDVLAASRLNAMPFLREREEAAFGPTTALMQQLLQGTYACTIQPKVPSLLTGVAGKRGVNNGILENKTSQSHQDIPRKSRLEPRSPSFSSFKVRKEKLGDRIAALQQLVAPFGKTDTASVLMEAIGYIKFLQDQVETLSVPYLRLPKSKKQRTTPQGEASELGETEKKEEEKGDLRSRGLCLVPLSCTSYVTNENAYAPPLCSASCSWSSPHFPPTI